jgi:LysR family hydrogen peroxide-inducible transcriptional activator
VTLTLKQMRYAVAVAEERHFGRAALACNISQPALSQQIALIEAECGTPLFDRLNRAVLPTPFGLEFIERARKVLESADALAAFASGHKGELHRPIRFGLIPTVAPYLLPEIFPALTAVLPDLAFAVSENRTEALLAGLTEGSLDIALIGTAAPADGVKFASAPLFDDAFVLATSRDEPTANPVSLSALRPERILLLD